MDSLTDFDLGPLTWVKDEIDNALDTARAQIESWNGNDLGPLKTAATHLHQVNGALQMVDLQGVSQVCEASERLLTAMEQDPPTRTGASAQTLLQAIQAMKHYLDELVEHGSHTELALAPIYRGLLKQRGAPAPAPSDLFFPNLDIRAARLGTEPALDETHRQLVLHRARRQLQKGMVLWLTRRDVAAGLAAMHAAARAIEQVVPGAAQYTFWWTVTGLLEALEHGEVEADIWLKRLIGRIDLQLKRLIDGSRQIAERLLRDILYYQAGLPGAKGRSAEVNSLFELPRLLPVAPVADANAALRPKIKALRETLEQGKDHWLRFCSGKADSLPMFQQVLRSAAEQAKPLSHPPLDEIIGVLGNIGQRLGGMPQATQNEALHLELATTLLFTQNAIDHFDALGDEFTAQVKMQARRLHAALDPEGALARMPSLPLLDEFSRQAQEKLLIAQVTHEIQSNLQQVETILDAFFRNRAERGGLPLVPGLMNQILGALNMLQLDVAADLVRLGMAEISVLSEPGREISQEELDWIADAVSSLGIYVEALSHGRDEQASLRSLLAGPAAGKAEPSLESTVQEKAADIKDKLEQWTTEPASKQDKAEIREELIQISQDAELIGDHALQSQAGTALRLIEAAAPDAEVQNAFQTDTVPVAAPDAQTMRLAEASIEEIDAELLGIYIAEAHEVLDNVALELDTLRLAPADQGGFVSIRRGFHTLKGSGRMVGLGSLAEVAWEVEQTLNLWLRDSRIPSQELLDFVAVAIDAFRGWVRQLETQGQAQVEADELVAQARDLRGDDLPIVEPPPQAQPTAAMTAPSVEDQRTHIGGHTLPTPLYDIFCAEAHQRLDELDRHWADLRHANLPQDWESFARSAHTLAGISRTTGFMPLAEAAHALESWAYGWADSTGHAAEADAPVMALLARLHQQYQDIIAGQNPGSADDVRHALPAPPAPAATPDQPGAMAVPSDAADIMAAVESNVPAGETLQDELDPELLSIFLAEADELLPRIGESLRHWRARPDDAAPRQALQRALHTLKGSARMAGALNLGEATHRVESRIAEHGQIAVDPVYLESLEHDYDHLADLVERLRPHPAGMAAVGGADSSTAQPVLPAQTMVPEDEGRFRNVFKSRPMALDTLINETGEVSIARARIENVLTNYKQTAEELTVNIERLRSQLRELELQAETQMRAHLASVDDSHFDPLEFDRYTRLQELTRLMAESVNDVSTAQEGLLANLADAESALAHQAKMTRSLQQQLMHIRMVPLNSQAERLHRIVRQAAKETGHRARLQIEGGATELDRSVLEKVFVPLEHLLRNAVAHGIESAEQRKAAGKPEYGEVRLSAMTEGNEVVLCLSDDGAGIDLEQVRQRAEQLGWLAAGEAASDERLEAMLFMPGLSTARTVTQVAGRGIGLDVVKNEIAAIGGRIRLESQPGQGTRAILRLPLTLALAQVVLAKAGKQTYALPANLVALVREVRQEDWPAIAGAESVEFDGQSYPLRSLTQLTGQEPTPLEGRFRTLLLLRAGAERVALRVDALQGNAEAVVKNLGPQLARITGIAGATVLGDGRVALILNPFALMERSVAARMAPEAIQDQSQQAPLIMVVDDSLTVRKITGRLLQRNGYRVATAKDGAEAMELLQDELPAVMLLDIEMPRMDGFEVTRHVRADAKTHDLPIIIISSRTAEKHRQHAFDLGIDTFMGKPYQDDALLQEIDSLRRRAPGSGHNGQRYTQGT
jgi:chemosensory pili system protein ChpA (sensor histidine kinase/response regulator)